MRRDQQVINSTEVRTTVANGYDDWRELVRAAVAAYDRLSGTRPEFVNLHSDRHTPDEQIAREVDQVWREFWHPLFVRHCGDAYLGDPAQTQLFLVQLKKELYDAHQLMHNLSLIYCEISGGIVSKPLTKPEAVVELAQEHYYGFRDDDWREFLESLREDRKDDGLMISWDELFAAAQAEFPKGER